MDPMEFGSQNYWCFSFHICLMAYEIADRLVDFFIAENYDDGSIISNPKKSVQAALTAFFAIGLPMTVLRVVFYLQRMQLYRTGDESKDKTHHAINLWMSWAKTLFEAFPQATIAKFCFGDCAETDGTKTLVQAFNVFSIFPFIMFVCYVSFYYRAYVEETNRVMVYSVVMTFIFCRTGCIFAGISITDFNELCKQPEL